MISLYCLLVAYMMLSRLLIKYTLVDLFTFSRFTSELTHHFGEWEKFRGVPSEATLIWMGKKKAKTSIVSDLEKRGGG